MERVKKRYFYFWVILLIFSLIALALMFRGGITGNPVYKIYNIEDFPGIYVDFGPTQTETSTKWGSAAVGNFGEFWNSPFIPESQYTFLPLRYANGDLSNMKIQISHLDKSGSIKSNLGDEMFDSYVISENINKVSSITVDNLIDGFYDIYLYGNLENSNANYELYRYFIQEGEIKSEFLGIKSTYINSNVLLKDNWEEGTHFIVYRDVEFKEGDFFEIIVKSFDINGEKSYSFISGMQLVKSGTPLAYNATFSSKNLECFDSDGGINYSISGKIYVNGRYSSEDLCDNQNIYLTELYCERGIKSLESYKCENGCVDGFCVPDFKFDACDGCLFNQICISKGSRVDNKYCDIDKFLKVQKSETMNCDNYFECYTNSCIDGKCESLDSIARRELGIKYSFVKFVCRVSNLNDEGYQECLEEAFQPLINQNINKNNENIENKSSTKENNYSFIPLPETTK